MLNLKEEKLEASIDPKKVGEIVLDALCEVLRHIPSANTAEIMMAFTVMIKSTLISMDLSDIERHQAKLLFDAIWDQVLNDQLEDHAMMSQSVH
ncbi:hypothetical protein ICN48_13135 [Polynucleobacter sp. JS-Safj-400b-B2]|jgi:hypothetical protein|uniref:hypothetical protein n=1 Tax=Polynucleobacter sp. JS-Safj-400b-B2 TaxID=2576921 RepID=UPI001C0AD663|nr:hypothetical protein [Polynucleobacter sp. JS-Safj-400b-B2]MBU3627169.1 hypothetical protein [Polynucleobacter sp. JS-Safj-400b-B2]